MLWHARQLPGSDAQFQFVRYFAALATNPAQAAAVSDIRSGAAGLVGLEIDADLGWELLESLVRNGAAGADEIAESLANDNTAGGQFSALRSTAAIPTREAKRAAFDSVVLVDDKSNSLVRGVTSGFQDVNDPALLEDLVEPYFAMISDVWASRSYKIAEAIIPGQIALRPGLYPSPLASQGTRRQDEGVARREPAGSTRRCAGCSRRSWRSSNVHLWPRRRTPRNALPELLPWVRGFTRWLGAIRSINRKRQTNDARRNHDRSSWAHQALRREDRR